MDWRTKGKEFELAEKAEWLGQRVSFERSVIFQNGGHGRIDIFIDEHGGFKTIIEVKATDWGAMADHRVRSNLLRHVRQLMKYVYPFWNRGVDVCPGIIYPRPPALSERRKQIEVALEERSIQLVWFNEREASA